MRKLIHLSFIIILTSISYHLRADFVKQQKAELVGKNFYYQRINSKQITDYNSIKIASVFTQKRNSQITLYIFNIKNQGYVIVSADDDAYPVLAYDFEENIDLENPPPAFMEWLGGYSDQIEEIRQLHLEGDRRIDSLWTTLSGSAKGLTVFGGKSQDPLLLSKWDQGAGYNAECPLDQFGPGGHPYAGCVAVAMAQVMYYYKYPLQGTGTHSYYHTVYGQLSANFGSTQYKWNEMSNKLPGGGSFEIAQLLYHCGVSVDMNYTANGSGAWSNRCVSAYKNYFGYSNSVYIDDKSSYNTNQWYSKLMQSLNNKIPLYYHGYPTTGSGAGHAFNLDGYQGFDHYHFNWGWGGAYNGYFYLNNLNPGGSDFSGGQGAIFEIKPESSAYPYGCLSLNTITSKDGVIFDGSGPDNYENSKDCRWLIAPSMLVDHIVLTFDRIALDTNDYITIYDGTTTQDSILGNFSGQNLPPSISSTGQRLLIRFKTDSTGNDEGFDLSYRSVMPVFCHGTLTLTDTSGIISDGSDTNDYNNGVMCRWLIDAPGQPGIKLNFSKFDTETGKDWIKIYDPATSPVTLLAQYSGHNLPPSVTATHGKMLIIFATSQENSFAGWEAHYYTGPVGINNEVVASEIKVYPNPAHGKLSIDMGDNTEDVLKLELSSLDGKSLISVKPLGNSVINMNISSFSSGIYLLTIYQKDGVVRRKVEVY